MNLCLISEAGAGKDTVSDLLDTHYGYTRYAFADNVKNVADKWFPHLYDVKSKPRWLLQAIGTKFREIDPEVWIKSMFEDIDDKKAIGDRYGLIDEFIVITDCRMPNEYEALKDRGFTFIRITVEEETRNRRMKDRGDSFTEEDMQHHTESFYDTFKCEYEVSNNGTLENLKQELDRVMVSVMKKEEVE